MNKVIATTAGIAIIGLSLFLVLEFKMRNEVKKAQKVFNLAENKILSIAEDWTVFKSKTTGSDFLEIKSNSNPAGSIMIGGVVPNAQVKAEVDKFANSLAWDKGVYTSQIHINTEQYQKILESE